MRSVRLCGSACGLPLTHDVHHWLEWDVSELMFHFSNSEGSYGTGVISAPASARILSSSIGSRTFGVTSASCHPRFPSALAVISTPSFFRTPTHDFCESLDCTHHFCESPGSLHRFYDLLDVCIDSVNLLDVRIDSVNLLDVRINSVNVLDGRMASVTLLDVRMASVNLQIVHTTNLHSPFVP